MLKKIRINFDILLEFVVVTLFVISLLPKNVANKEISNIENSKLDTNFSYNYENVGDNEESKEEVKEIFVHLLYLFDFTNFYYQPKRFRFHNFYSYSFFNNRKRVWNMFRKKGKFCYCYTPFLFLPIRFFFINYSFN